MTNDSTQVLVADDDRLCRRMLEGALSGWGFAVESVSDGRQAFERLAGDESPRLVILDWQMPELDGVQVCRKIRQQRSLTDLYILMLTTRATRADLAEALEAGANDYVTKPFDATELEARLRVGDRLVGGTRLSARGAMTRLDTPSVGTPINTGPTVQQSLQSEYLIPVFDPQTMQYSFGIPSALLRAWEDDGTLQRVLLDRVQKCPECLSLPTFRFGCPSCGSGCVSNDRLIHHFPCAHVADVAEFERDGQLSCPKCRAHDLVVGADFEYMNGPFRCLNCTWSATDADHIGHCVKCGIRFPADQAVVEDLIGYHVNRMDVVGSELESPAGSSAVPSMSLLRPV